MHDEDLFGEPTTRAGFVKRLGKLAAIGLGVALVPATNALAVNIPCCRSTFCDAQCQSCGTCSPYGYLCPSNPCASCCTCHIAVLANCINFPQCPC